MADKYSLGMILEEVYRLDFKEFEVPQKHRFSFHNRIRINRIISEYAKNPIRTKTVSRKLNRRFITAAVIVIMLAAFAVTAAAVLLLNGFIQKEYSDNTQLFVEDFENCPATIEHIYYLSALPSGYEYWDGGVTQASNTNIYINRKNGYTLTFQQSVKSEFTGNYNNEGYELQEIKINGHNGIYIDYSTDNQSRTCLIWDNGDYILELMCVMNKEDAINLAKSVKK